MTTELCSTCSLIFPTLGDPRHQILGTYDEVLGRARTLGHGRGGFGSCAFFCTALQCSVNTALGGMQLSKYINLDYSGLTLHARTADQLYLGSLGHKVRFNLCTTEGNKRGSLSCCDSRNAELTLS